MWYLVFSGIFILLLYWIKRQKYYNLKYEFSEKEYANIITQYLPNEMSKIIFEYIEYHITEWTWTGHFQTETRIYDMCCDDTFLYTIEDDAKFIRKYKLKDNKLVDSWMFDDERKMDEFYICRIAVNKKYVFVINYIRNCICMYTKDGKLYNKTVFEFILPNPIYLDDYINSDCLEMGKPVNERSNFLKEYFYNKDRMLNRLKFYSMCVNEKYIIIGIGFCCVIFVIKKTHILKKTEKYYLNRINDIVLSDDYLIVKQRYGIIISHIKSSELKLKFKIKSYYENNSSSSYGKRVCYNNGNILVSNSGKIDIYDMNGIEIGTLHKHNYWFDKFYVAQTRIYMLVDDSLRNGNFMIHIMELKYKF